MGLVEAAPQQQQQCGCGGNSVGLVGAVLSSSGTTVEGWWRQQQRGSACNSGNNNSVRVSQQKWTLQLRILNFGVAEESGFSNN